MSQSRNATCVWLYGSHARGQADDASDQDILVVSDQEISKSWVKEVIPDAYSDPHVSRYTWHEIQGMAEYGSLFLQHLRMEAVPIFESARNQGRLRSILDKLSNYKLAGRDLRGFSITLDDVEDSVNESGQNSFELSVIGTVVRHCSILGCWIIGQPSFARYEPVKIFVSQIGLNREISQEFDLLYQHRLYQYGRISELSEKSVSASTWIERARILVDAIGGLRNERS